MLGIKILGTGAYAPEKIVTNEDFTRVVETSDEWIYTRTGMKKRHISQGEPTWYMGACAAKKAIEGAGIDASEIGLIIDTTVTQDYFTPSTACIIQNEIGANGSMAIDVNAACAGFVYAIDMARRYLVTDESIKYALVIANEKLSKLTDYTDRSTCVLFGDAAAACVVALDSDTVYTSHLGADGAGAKFLFAKSIECDNPFMTEDKTHIECSIPDTDNHFLHQSGKDVYKFAIKALPEAVRAAAKKINMEIGGIDFIIPHQANIRIIETAADNLGVSMDKFYINMQDYGNTSSASIPLAFDEAIKEGKIKRGDIVCFVGFGAGLTYGATIFKY